MKHWHKLMYWAPRVLAILAILFISMFALDAFGHGKPFAEQLLDFAMHMIPSFVLTIVLIVAWKWELIGGLIFFGIGAFFTPVIYNHNYNMNHSVSMTLGIVFLITVPFIAIGLLFIANHFLNKKLRA